MLGLKCLVGNKGVADDKKSDWNGKAGLKSAPAAIEGGAKVFDWAQLSEMSPKIQRWDFPWDVEATRR